MDFTSASVSNNCWCFKHETHNKLVKEKGTSIQKKIILTLKINNPWRSSYVLSRSPESMEMSPTWGCAVQREESHQLHLPLVPVDCWNNFPLLMEQSFNFEKPLGTMRRIKGTSKSEQTSGWIQYWRRASHSKGNCPCSHWGKLFSHFIHNRFRKATDPSYLLFLNHISLLERAVLASLWK